MERVKLAFVAARSLMELTILKVVHHNLYFKNPIIKSTSSRVRLVKSGRISIGKKVRLNEGCEIKSSNCVEIGSGSEIGKGTAIISTRTGVIKIEDNVFFNRNCTVVSCESISIGAGTAIGYNVIILDHDHYFVPEGEQPWNEIKTSPVVIGKNVWIGANTTILAGTHIGDNCVIAAGSVIKGDIEKSKLVIQKRSTEIRTIKGKR